MNMSHAIVTLPLLLWPLAVSAQVQERPEEADIRAVFERLESAWSDADGQAWGAEFAEDADFTVWFGLRLRGRDEIAAGHDIILSSIYAGTTFEMEVEGIRFVGDDVALARLEGRVTEAGEPRPAEPDAVPLAVLRREGGGDWEIIAFQNTPQVVDEFRENGDLRRFKALVAELQGR
jgi:uncharacterized protein (TIGR02246 family)